MAQAPNSVTPESLLDLTQSLVEIPSVSRQEKEIADYVEAALGDIDHLTTERIQNNLVARTNLGAPMRLLIGGHLDTVSHPRRFKAKRIDRSSEPALEGPGAVDMKGGLAVMLELAKVVPNIDLSFLFYAAEEIEIRESGLRHVESVRPDLLEADAAILLEPTGGAIEAGCQGTMKVMLSVNGKRAHTARAFNGTNAIHRMGAVLTALQEYTPRRPVIEGCEFYEAIQAVSISGGVAGNVVPDVAEVLINIRFAPDKSWDFALEELVQIVESTLGASSKTIAPPKTIAGSVLQKQPSIKLEGPIFEVIDVANPAMPSLSHPLLSALVDQVKEVRAKLGWTDVSFFYEKNIPALNFGPGDPGLSHTTAESVSGQELMDVYQKLNALISN